MSTYSWSTTAGSNDSADASINWLEGQLPSTVNNSARAMMAALKALINDQGGSAVLGGAGNTFTLALSQAMLARVPSLIGFFATRSNTGAVTMQIDATTAAPLRAVSGAELVSGQILNGAFYVISWNGVTSEWIIVGQFAITASDIAAISNSTVLGNFSGGAASPSATTMATLFANTPNNAITKAMQEQAPTSTVRGNDSGAAALGSATVTITIATPGVVTWTAHGMAANDPFSLTTTGALPTGLSVDVIYYVSATGLVAGSFQCSATAGGASINTTGTQSGTHTGARLAKANLQEVTFAKLKSTVLKENINPQVGTTYTFTFNDLKKLVTFNNASSIAATLPQATGSFGADEWIEVQNVGVGLVTITPTTSTVDGATVLIVPSGYGVKIVSDGTNYQIAGMNPLKGRVLLNTLTASASATLDDITSFTAVFSEYEIVLVNLIPATTAVSLNLRVHSAGVFKSTGYNANLLRTAGAAPTVTSSTAFIALAGSASLVFDDPGVSGLARVSSPSGTTGRKMWSGLMGALGGGVAELNTAVGFWDGGNGAITGFRLLMSSGNITSGTVKIYGWN